LLARGGLRCFRLNTPESNDSFSDDISLLVTVSRRGRPLTLSKVPSDPDRSLLSGGREGDVTKSEGPSLLLGLLMGEDPALVRTGIFLNLI
jgi:hypothetical protein